MQEHSGIKIAAACPHHEAAGRRQSHARIDGDAISQRRHARAIAQVGDYRALSELSSQLAHNILVRESVEPITFDPLLPEFVWQGKPPCDLRHAAVERRVKASHL